MARNNDKRRNNEIDELPPEKYWPTLDNKFVEDYRNGKFIYSKDFYVALYKKIDSGMTYVEAYKALGFDISVLGEDRANACGKRAVQMAKEGKLNTCDPSTYDGSVAEEDMGPMTDAERYAYLQARVKYLQSLYDLKKKFLSESLGRPATSKDMKKY